MKKNDHVKIFIKYQGRLDCIQHAPDIKTAQNLIKNILPPLKTGYNYTYITSTKPLPA